MLSLLVLSALHLASTQSRADLVVTQATRDESGATTRAVIVEDDAESLFQAMQFPVKETGYSSEKQFQTSDGHVQLLCGKTQSEYRCTLTILSVIRNEAERVGDTAVLVAEDSTSATNLSDSARTLYASLELPVKDGAKKFATADGMASISCSAGSCLFAIRLKLDTTIKPLIGSLWARKNPGKLPFETCAIVSLARNGGGEKNLTTEPSLSIFYGRQHFTADVRPALVCTTEKLGLEFAIPITIDRFRRYGFDFDAGEVTGDSSVTVGHLNGKRASDFFGHYGGVEASAALVIGNGGFAARNHAGIAIRDEHRDRRVGVDLGYVGFRVSRRDLAEDDAINPVSVLPERVLSFQFVRVR